MKEKISNLMNDKNKKLIIISAGVILVIAILVTVMVVTMSKKPKEYDTDTTRDSAETTTIQFTTDEDGNLFVTNINGDLIPVTTNKAGYVDSIDDLTGKTPEQAESEKDNQNGNNQGGGNNEGTTGGGIQVGDGDDQGKDAVIKWN